MAVGSRTPAESPPPERRPQQAEGPAPGLAGGDRGRRASPQLRGRHPTQQLEAAAEKLRGNPALAERPPWDRGSRPGGTPAAQAPRSAQQSPARETARRPQQAPSESWRSPQQSPSRDTADRLQQASADLRQSAQPSPARDAQHQAAAESRQSARQSPAREVARRLQQAAVPTYPREQPVGWGASLTSGSQPQSLLSGQGSQARPVRELPPPQPGPALQGAAQLVQPGAGRRRAAGGRAGFEPPAGLQPGLSEGSGAGAAQPVAGLLAALEEAPPGLGGQLMGMQQQPTTSRLPQPLQHGPELFRQPESVAWQGEADARSGRRLAQGEAAPRPSHVTVGVSCSTIKSTLGQHLTCPSHGRKQQDGQHCMTHRWRHAGCFQHPLLCRELQGGCMRAPPGRRCMSASGLLLPAETAALRQLPSLNTDTSSSSGASGRLVAAGRLVPTGSGAQPSSPVSGDGAVLQTRRPPFAPARSGLRSALGADAMHSSLPPPEEADQVGSSVSSASRTARLQATQSVSVQRSGS